jgi:MFS family permease
VSSKSAARTVYLAFGAFGLVMGLSEVVLPDLQAALRLSPAALGLALTLGSLGSFPAMPVGGRLADRWGARRIITGAALLMGLAFLSLAGVNRWWLLVIVLLAYYGGLGVLDVSANSAAIGVEQVTGRRVMAYFHAAFSGLGAVGAVVAGLLAWVGVPFRWQYVLGASALLLMAGYVWRSVSLPAPATPRRANPAELGGPGPAPAIPRRANPSEMGGPGPAPERANPTTQKVTSRPGLRTLPAAIFVLAAIASLSMFSESSLEIWSAIYLRTALGLPAVLGAAGPVVFHAAMLAGRLGNGGLVGRLGRRRLLLGAGALTAGGMALALATTWLPLILAGMLIAGLALAGIVPAAFSLAGDLTPHRAGEASSLITTIGYLGPLVGPALIGGLAQLADLRVGLGTLIVAGALVVILSSRTRETGIQAAPAQPETA